MNLACLFLLLCFQDPEAATVAVRAGSVRTVANGTVDSGVILIRGGKIISVGKDSKIPKGLRVIDLGAKTVVTPGFIDAHSYLGSARDVEEITEAVTPHMHALDAFASQNSDVQEALRSGVTLVSIAPGPGNLISGRTGLIRFSGTRLDQLLYRNPHGMKVGLTDWVLRRDRKPTSASGALVWLRDLLGGEIGNQVRKEGIPVYFDDRSARQIRVAIALEKEFTLEAILVHADEASRVIPEIQKSGIPVVLSPLGISDPVEYLSTPSRLAKAGVPFAFASDAPLTGESYLRLSAALAMRYGLKGEAALRSLTLSAAEILGVSREVGSLESGKLADLVIFDGDPLDLTSDVLLVMVGGEIVFQRDKK